MSGLYHYRLRKQNKKGKQLKEVKNKKYIKKLSKTDH